MLDDADPRSYSARMLRLEAAYWRDRAACLDDNGDTFERDDLLAMASANERIAARVECRA